MTYFRRPLGDGPVTSPHEVDPTLPPPGEATVSDVVTPTRRTCAELPADSFWKQPGQVCAERNMVMEALEYLRGLLPNTLPPPPAPTVQPASVWPKLMIIGGAGVGAYYLLRKRKRS